MAVSNKKRLFVTERAYHCCEYCQCIAEFIPVPFVMEHIIPVIKGGSDEVDNLAHACHHCNGAKYSKIEGIDEESNQIVPLFHPRRDKWTEHFVWSDDFMEIIGITATGRATVTTLKLNREKVINHRQLLFLFGNHPPKHTIV